MSTGNNSATDVVTTTSQSVATTPTTPTTTSQETTTTTEQTTTSPTTSTAPTTTTTSQTTAQTQPTTTPTSTKAQTTSTQPTTSSQPTPSQTTTTTVVASSSESGTTSTLFVTRTTTPTTPGSSSTTTATTSSSSAAVGSGGNSSGGLSTAGKISVAVVVPIAAVALIVVVGLFLWRKRRARKNAEEARKQEIDDYGFNPNNDPTIPSLPAAGAYEMKDENTAGYRGWGSTTLAGSAGNKASTTISGSGVAGEPLISDGAASPEGEILGAMGPSTSQNRGGDVQRGPSNASSSYSAAARSDDSGGIGVAYGGPNAYYDQYSPTNPYADNPYSVAPGPRPGPGPADTAGQPIIRDNPHRRNTRIENPSPYAQQPGISQNF